MNQVDKNQKKLELGQYYTVFNPFKHFRFNEWFLNALKNSNNQVLEPFAGSNNLIKMLKENYQFEFKSYDLEPNNIKEVEQLDTLKYFPKGFNLVITNPPYLSKNKSTKYKIPFPNSKFDDLYKLCLKITLENVDYAAFIIPASFINAKTINLWDRLDTYILLNKKMFNDTDTPVCLALFSPKSEISKKQLFVGEKELLDWESLKNQIDYEFPKANSHHKIQFNSIEGNLGLFAVDSPKGKSIRFCLSDEVDKYPIKTSSRNITKILIDKKINQDDINDLNNLIEKYRNISNDIFLNSFKGLIKDGNDYRKRLDYRTARIIITKFLEGTIND